MNSQPGFYDVSTLLHLTVSAIVKDRDHVAVEMLKSPCGANVSYRIHVSDRDRSALQGRGGQIARALRIIFHAIGQENSVIYQLDL